MKWKAEKDGLTVVFTKGNIRVVWHPYMWDRKGNRYEVVRTDGETEQVVEKGFVGNPDIGKLLPYVYRNWSNQNTEKQ